MRRVKEDINPYYDPITGVKLRIPNPLNKKKYDRFEVDEYLNCLD
jgi:hypothetical protein